MPGSLLPTLLSLQASLTTTQTQVAQMIAQLGPPFARPKFAPSSWCYQPIPANAALHPNSAALVQTFLGQLSGRSGQVGTNIHQYTAPIYNPALTDPDIAVKVIAQNWGTAQQPNWVTDPGLVAQWSKVKIPAWCVASDGTDAEFSVYDPANDSLLEVWASANANGQWSGTWGGYMVGCSTNPAIWQQRYGGAATGLPYTAGQINADELAAGAINHVIGLAVGAADNWNVYSYPANRSDGWNPPPGLANQIPEGLRFRLDPTLNLSALNLTPLCLLIAKAAQIYGFVIWDKTGGAPSIRFENPLSYTQLGLADPYLPLLGGMQDYQVLDGFPWQSLQALPINYGEPGN